jgi:hypothetical protein
MTVESLPPTGWPPGPDSDGRGATSRKGWTLALASFGVFLTSLDVVVVATALPTLRTDLHASLSQLEWTINAYNLVFACLMLTGAAIGDRYGRRQTYVAGLVVFRRCCAVRDRDRADHRPDGARRRRRGDHAPDADPDQ